MFQSEEKIDNKVFTCYQRAQTIVQGILSKRLVLNDAVFPHWIGTSDCFWYQRETKEGKEYRIVDAIAATNQFAFDHQALANALAKASNKKLDPQDLPISGVEIQLSPRQVRFSAFDQHWVFNSKKKTCETVEPTCVDGLCSPDGNKTAFVRDHNLWMKDLVSGEERALTWDGAVDYHYGSDRVHTSAVQAVWSPDSRRLFTHQLDLRHVASTPFVHHVPQDSSLRPQLTQQKISYPGDVQVESYRLVAIDINSGALQTAQYGPLTLCRAGSGFFSEERFGWWAKDSQRAFFVDVARGAQTVRLVEFDTESGVTRILFEETSPTFVKLSHTPFERPIILPLADSDELIWFSERSGWAHLYLYDLKSGKLKNSITGGEPSTGLHKEWLVRDVLHVDIERRELLVQTAARNPNINPYYRDICRVNIDTGELIVLVSGAFDYVVYSFDSYNVKIRNQLGLDGADVSGVSPCGNYIVLTRSRVDEVPVSLLLDCAGKVVLTLETADPVGLPEGWQWPEPVKLKAANGQTDLYGVVYRPPDFSSEKRYAVLDFSCAHPAYSYVAHAAFINGHFLGAPYLEGAAYAALGFIVVAMEVPGMPYRHRVFQEGSYGCMASVNGFADRISGLQQLANRYAYMDLERVGVVGCDGITGPVYALLQHPEFYKVGVMAALEDTRFIPAFLGELFEGVAGQYSETSYTQLVASLEGKLLLIHGMLDYGTPMVATMLLVDALRRGNKDFDLLLLPNDGHEISSYALRRTWDYLVTHLQGIEPPKAFKLTTAEDLLSPK